MTKLTITMETAYNHPHLTTHSVIFNPETNTVYVSSTNNACSADVFHGRHLVLFRIPNGTADTSLVRRFIEREADVIDSLASCVEVWTDGQGNERGRLNHVGEELAAGIEMAFDDLKVNLPTFGELNPDELKSLVNEFLSEQPMTLATWVENWVKEQREEGLHYDESSVLEDLDDALTLDAVMAHVEQSAEDDNTTLAEAVGHVYGDSLNFDVGGVDLEDLLEKMCCADYDAYGTYRYEFEDESTLIISAGSAWDFGIDDGRGCHCWESTGHTDECNSEWFKKPNKIAAFIRKNVENNVLAPNAVGREYEDHVAGFFDDDGGQGYVEGSRGTLTIDDVCGELAEHKSTQDEDDCYSPIRYVFPDGSVIVTLNTSRALGCREWDFGLRDRECFCTTDQGHTDACNEKHSQNS